MIYNALTLLNLECLKAGELVNQFFTENIKEKVRELAKVLDEEDGDKTLVSKKVEDPEWFAGILLSQLFMQKQGLIHVQ